MKIPAGLEGGRRRAGYGKEPARASVSATEMNQAPKVATLGVAQGTVDPPKRIIVNPPSVSAVPAARLPKPTPKPVVVIRDNPPARGPGGQALPEKKTPPVVPVGPFKGSTGLPNMSAVQILGSGTSPALPPSSPASDTANIPVADNPPVGRITLWARIVAWILHRNLPGLADGTVTAPPSSVTPPSAALPGGPPAVSVVAPVLDKPLNVPSVSDVLKKYPIPTIGSVYGHDWEVYGERAWERGRGK